MDLVTPPPAFVISIRLVPVRTKEKTSVLLKASGFSPER